jgi:hypothetical protein
LFGIVWSIGVGVGVGVCSFDVYGWRVEVIGIRANDDLTMVWLRL